MQLKLLKIKPALSQASLLTLGGHECDANTPRSNRKHEQLTSKKMFFLNLCGKGFVSEFFFFFHWRSFAANRDVRLEFDEVVTHVTPPSWMERMPNRHRDLISCIASQQDKPKDVSALSCSLEAPS